MDDDRAYLSAQDKDTLVGMLMEQAMDDDRLRGGAQQGHLGHGRRTVENADADRVETVVVDAERRPQCREPLEDRGYRTRSVIDCPPVVPHPIVYRLQRKRCPRCRRTFAARAPQVLPRSLYGNQLLTHLAVQHYVYGVPLGRLEAQTTIGYGSLLDALHRLGRLCAGVPARLLLEYRQAPVKHADETGWRTDGLDGYAWIFATPTLSLFRFRQTRSASVPREAFGPRRLPGVLVVDRYHAYSRLPCRLQYCYAHLLRDLQDIEREFADNPEVQRFGQTLGPLLARAMGLRAESMTQARFAVEARKLKAQIITVINADAHHAGIHKIQAIFRENSTRLYHWATDRRVPAENNLAERERRPLVIARKVSFGSQFAGRRPHPRDPHDRARHSASALPRGLSGPIQKRSRPTRAQPQAGTVPLAVPQPLSPLSAPKRKSEAVVIALAPYRD